MDNKYYQNYRRFTYDWSYEDQEEYGKLEERLNELESMEIVSAEEYEMETAHRTGADLEQYVSSHITETEYYFEKEEVVEGMKKMESFYRVTEEQLADDKRVRAQYARDRLRMIKKSYESRGNHGIMRDVDVDALTDDQAIEMYRNMKAGISDEMDHEIGNRAIWDRVGGKKKTGPKKSGGTDKETIEELIAKFNKDAETMKKHLGRVKAAMGLDALVNIEMSEEIKSLETELRALEQEADALISEIDGFRARTGEADFSMSVAEIKATIKGFKTRLRDLKRKQVELYNIRVDVLNERIAYLKSLKVEDEKVKLLIEQLVFLTRCDMEVKDWKSSKYLSVINFTEIIRIETIIIEITTIGKIVIPKLDDFDVRMINIEMRIESLDAMAKDGLTANEIAGLKQGVIMVADDINMFRVLLENNKDQMTDERYQNFLKRLNDAEANLANVNDKINKLKPVGGSDGGTDEKTDDKDYKELMNKLNMLSIQVDNFLDLIGDLEGKISLDAISVYDEKLNNYEAELNKIVEEIEAKKAEGKLDENQYNNLMKKVEEIKLAIKKGRDMSHSVIPKEDIFDYLNGRIDGVEAALDKLEAEVEALEKPIKDRHIRKQIDLIIARLEEEIREIGQLLEKHKEDDPEKYEATKARLDACQERLDKISKKYRSKCPLHVRVVKGAKDFYKKHKKIVLIAAGLAAIALIHATVGPILIPAIMHGNLMIGATTPALRGFTMFANNILGGLIGATKNVHGIWALANGVVINPNMAATSLLKGVAISGIGSAMMVAPVVVAVKKLIDKMKKTDLKKKIGEEKEKREKKRKEKPKKEKKTGDKKADKKTEEEIIQLFRDYRKSGKTIEEYCQENELSEEDKMILEYFEERYKKNAEAEKESGRRGR